jgi:hypothetical protein
VPYTLRGAHFFAVTDYSFRRVIFGHPRGKNRAIFTVEATSPLGMRATKSFSLDALAISQAKNFYR